MQNDKETVQDPAENPRPQRSGFAETLIALGYGAVLGFIGWLIGRAGDQGTRRTGQIFLGTLGALTGVFVRAHIVLRDRLKETKAEQETPAEPAAVKVETPEVKPIDQVPAPIVAAKTVETKERVADEPAIEAAAQRI